MPRCLVVKWTGNGVGVSRDIQWTSVIFTPDIVLLMSNPSSVHVRATAKSHNIQTDADVTANAVEQLYANGFRVDGPNFNVAGTAYVAVAFRELSGAIAQGTWVGGSDPNRKITLGWKPKMVWSGGPNSGVSPWISSVDGHGFRAFTSTPFGADPIETYLADGFKWSAASNFSSSTYKYIAFAESVDDIDFISYTGNGPGANQTLTATVPPKYVFWHANSARDAGVFGQHHKSFHLATNVVQAVGGSSNFDPAASVDIAASTITVQHPGGGSGSDGIGIVNKGGQLYSAFAFDAYLITLEDEVPPGAAVLEASPGNLFSFGWQAPRRELPFPHPLLKLARAQRLTAAPKPFEVLARAQSLTGRERGGVAGGGEGVPESYSQLPRLGRGRKTVRGLTAKDARAFDGRPHG